MGKPDNPNPSLEGATKKDMVDCVNFLFTIENGPAVDVKAMEDMFYFYNSSGDVVHVAPRSQFFN